MRIAIYSGQIPGTTFIERLITGLAKKGNTILLFGNKERDVAYPPNIHVHHMPEGKLNMVGYVLWNTLRLLVKHPKMARKVVGIASNYRGNRLRYLTKMLPVALDRPDIFHIQWAKSLKDWIWLQEIGVKLVVSMRGSHINYSPVADPALSETYKKLFPTVNAFHGVSNAIGKEARQYGAYNVKTIYSGLVLDNIKYWDGDKKNTRLEIISIGRWHWTKGFNYAIDAMHILDEKNIDFHYTIIAGQPSEEVIFHINSLHLKNKITVLDTLPHAEVVEKMKQADVLLLSSVSEGVANVVLEAMAAGTLVLSTDCGGMHEVINDGENGFLVPARDSRAIAERLIDIKGLSTERISGIRKNARMTIEEKHDIEKMVEEFENLYKSI